MCQFSPSEKITFSSAVKNALSAFIWMKSSPVSGLQTHFEVRDCNGTAGNNSAHRVEPVSEDVDARPSKQPHKENATYNQK